MVPVIGEVCDVASGVISLAKGDWAGVGMSLASAIPLIGNAAGGAKIVKNAVKIADKVDDTVDFVKGAEKTAGVASIVIKKTDDIVENSYKSFTKGNFRENLKILTNKTDEAIHGYQAHHVLPQKYQAKFSDVGLNIYEPKYGSWVDSSHQSWSKSYNNDWNQFLSGNPNKLQIEEYARNLGQNYNFQVNF